MITTIQVSKMTKQLLETLKAQEHAKTYDQVIHKLAQERMQIPNSMFGSIKGWKWNKQQDRMKAYDES